MPSYRLIVVEHTEGPRTGKFTDIVGTYDPRTKAKKFDEAKIQHWLSVGAKASDTVHNMFVSAGIVKGKKINVLPKYVEPVKDTPADAGEVAAPEAAPVASAPEAETTSEEEAPEAAPADLPAQEEEKAPETPTA